MILQSFIAYEQYAIAHSSQPTWVEQLVAYMTYKILEKAPTQKPQVFHLLR